MTSNIFPVQKSKVNVDTRWELLVVFGGGICFVMVKKNLFQIVCYFTSTLEEKCVDIKRLFSKEYSHDTLYRGMCTKDGSPKP